MRNFFAKLREYKQNQSDLALTSSIDDDVSPKLKKSRRWQMMDSTFQWKIAFVLMVLAAAITASPTQAKMPATQATDTSPAISAAFIGTVSINAININTTDTNTTNINTTDTDTNSPDTDAFFRKDKDAQVPIIMYHMITENRRYIGKYGISPSELKSDLEYLKNNGYNTIVMEDLINFVKKGKSLPKNPIILTFDDGNFSDYKYLFPLLQEYDMKAVISIIGKVTDKITVQHAENPTATYPNLTWPQVIQMQKSGLVEVQSHGYDLHGRAGSGKLRRESDNAYHQRLKADLQKLQDLCQEHLGSTPSTFCYPLGIISKGSHAVLDELGFVASLSCQEKMNHVKQGDDSCLLKLNRVNRASGRCIASILDELEQKS